MPLGIPPLCCGVAALVRDHNGTLLAGSAHNYYALSPLVAEARAIHEGLLLALQFPTSTIILESDSQSLISSITSNSMPNDWREANLIFQARYIAQTRQIS